MQEWIRFFTCYSSTNKGSSCQHRQRKHVQYSPMRCEHTRAITPVLPPPDVQLFFHSRTTGSHGSHLNRCPRY